MREGALSYSVVALLFITAAQLVLSSDPDPLQDLCVGDLDSALHPNGMLCKDSSMIHAEDFVFTGLRWPGNSTDSATGIARTVASALQFPGLNSLGMSIVRVDFEPGGVNPPHVHPRATEIALVADGTFYSGFVTTDNRVLAQVIHKGDVMVFPRGLVHFQRNVGKGPGVLFGTLNSQNPGTISLAQALFGSHIEDEVLAKAFQLTDEEIQALKGKLQPKPEPSL